VPVFQEANVADVTGERSEVDEVTAKAAGADATGEAFVPEEAPVFKEAIAADEVADETASTTGAPTADVPVVFSDQEDQSGSSS